MPRPIKRHQSLQPVSREHHFGLLLSWKIREGFRLKIAPERIKKYTEWFWKNHLQPHFYFEERHIFPLLDATNESIKKALREHRRLEKLFGPSDKLEENLSLIEAELVAHIRFEERILFKEVEQIASEQQLKNIEKAHSKSVVKNWEDEFWIKKSN